jgi:hypothetical protein
MQLALRIVAIAARLLMVLGLLCLVLGAYLSWQTLGFARGAQPATGKVVSYQEVDQDGEKRFRPRVRFRTAGGDIVTFHGQMAYTGHRYPVGSDVPVLYRHGQPIEARISNFVDNWLGATVALVVGGLCLVAGWFVSRSTRRAAG